MAAWCVTVAMAAIHRSSRSPVGSWWLACAALGVVAGTGSARADDEDRPPLGIYGFVRLDAIVDDSTMSDVQAPHYVMPETGASDAEVSLHPRLSRLGLSVDDWEVSERWTGQGQLEVDFQDGGDGTLATMRLRHAYVALTRREKLEVLVGQTWDLISPLFPSANNDSLMWDAGNTGGFRPQLRVSLMPSDKVRVAVAAAATGAIDHQDADQDGHLDGTAAGLPMGQALIEYRTRAGSKVPLRLGVWGHLAREELSTGEEVPSWSVGGHLFAPIGPRNVVMIEGYRGRNLDDIGGGIGQGYSTSRGRGIDAGGGWIEVATVLTRRHMFAVGESFDMVQAADVDMGERIANLVGYGVIRYKPHDSVQLGFEYSHWITRYKDAPSGNANRYNLHATVFF